MNVRISAESPESSHVRTNGDVWAEHGHPRRPCSPPEAVHGSTACHLAVIAPSAVEPHRDDDCWDEDCDVCMYGDEPVTTPPGATTSGGTS